MDRKAQDHVERLGALVQELPRHERVQLVEALSQLQARLTDGAMDRMLTPEEAAAVTGWRPGSDGGISPKWIYNNWRRLPAGIARKISHRTLRLHEAAWRRWIVEGEAIR